MLKLVIVGIIFVFNSVVCDEDILELTDEEYYQLPDLFAVENHEKCLSQRENAYCAGTFELSAPGPSQLYDVLKKFSENVQEKFNHTRLHRTVCLGPKTPHCPITGNLTESFERCIDERTFREHGLNAKLMDFFFCRRHGERIPVDGVDRSFNVFLTLIVVLNLIGTAYDFFLRDEDTKGNRWLMAFSLLANWKRLTAPSEGGDPRFDNFSCFNGVKALSMLLVHMAHAPILIILNFITNPLFAEGSARRPEAVLLFNGTVIVQSFIVVSNFLLAYKLLVHSERYKLKFSLLPKIVLDRVVRIYPMQLLSIAITATIAVHLSDGPLWYKYEIDEREFCRSTWWHHLLFIHNFFRPKCVPQSWYIAVDVQLCIISSAIMLYIISRGLNPEYILKRLFLASLLTVFGLVYTFQLEPALKIMRPETIFTLYKHEKSFRILYQSFWGNLPSAIVGLLLASIYYRLEKEKVDLSKNKLFVAINHLMVPAVWAWALMGYFFILTIKTRFTVSLYASIDKAGFATLVAILMLGCFYKIKGPATSILCWPGWLPLSRMSLGALMMHVIVNKHITLSRIHASTLNLTNMAADWFAVSVMTYIVVTPLTLMVEFPAVQLYKMATSAATPSKIAESEKEKPKYIVNENNNIIENPYFNGKTKVL